MEIFFSQKKNGLKKNKYQVGDSSLFSHWGCKIALRFHLTLVKMAASKETATDGEDGDEKEILCTAGENVKIMCHCRNHNGVSLKKIKLEAPKCCTSKEI